MPMPDGALMTIDKMSDEQLDAALMVSHGYRDRYPTLSEDAKRNVREQIRKLWAEAIDLTSFRRIAFLGVCVDSIAIFRVRLAANGIADDGTLLFQ